MKKRLIVVLLLIPLLLNANMASPINPGTLGARPFINRYVNVVHENLHITIDKDFRYAYFDIEYNIDSEKDGIKIPLLFYAYQYQGDFLVTIDGKPIQLKEFENLWNLYTTDDKEKFKNFEYLYQFKNKIDANITNLETIYVKDFLYFETNISKGKHRIKVSYKASAWMYKGSYLKDYSFRYALSPAKYWKSFGTLDVTIDASKCDKEISTNLGIPTNGTINTISKFHFDALPIDVLRINHKPKVTKITQFFMDFGAFYFAALLCLLMAIGHFFGMKKYREKNTKRWISLSFLLGSFILPIVFVVLWITSSIFIDYLIGKEASGRFSYGIFFAVIILPQLWIGYTIISFVFDLICKLYFKRK